MPDAEKAHVHDPGDPDQWEESLLRHLVDAHGEDPADVAESDYTDLIACHDYRHDRDYAPTCGSKGSAYPDCVCGLPRPHWDLHRCEVEAMHPGVRSHEWGWGQQKRDAVVTALLGQRQSGSKDADA